MSILYQSKTIAGTMSSFKATFCHLCIISVFGISTLFAEEMSSSTVPIDDGPKGNCSCGGFPTNSPAADVMPLLSQTPGLIVKCNDEGGNTCKSLCNALAIATKAKGPEILCNKLKEATELKLSAFYKICDRSWAYADITAEEPLCCAEAKVKACSSAERANATTPAVGTVEAKDWVNVVSKKPVKKKPNKNNRSETFWFPNHNQSNTEI